MLKKLNDTCEPVSPEISNESEHHNENDETRATPLYWTGRPACDIRFGPTDQGENVHSSSERGRDSRQTGNLDWYLDFHRRVPDLKTTQKVYTIILT